MCSIVLATSPVRWYLISVCGLERKALVRGVKLLSVGWIVNQSIHKFNRSANGAVSVAVKYIRLKRSYYIMSSTYPLCRLVPNYLNLGIKKTAPTCADTIGPQPIDVVFPRGRGETKLPQSWRQFSGWDKSSERREEGGSLCCWRWRLLMVQDATVRSQLWHLVYDASLHARS